MAAVAKKITIGLSLDKSQALADSIELGKAIKKNIEEQKSKISTSIDRTEFDKLINDLKKNANENSKVNLSVKVSNLDEVANLKKQVDQIKKDTGAEINLRFNIKQDSNIFNQINQSIKTTNLAFEDLGNKVASLKLEPTVKFEQITELQRVLAQLKKDTIDAGKQGIDIKADTSKILGLEKSLTDLGKNIKQVQSDAKNPIALKVIADAASRELETINQKLASIRNITATGLVIKFSEIGLSSILGTLGAVKDLAIGGFQGGLQIASQFQTIQVGLQNTLRNTAKSQFEANQAFATGKGTVEDLAMVTGKAATSFLAQEKATSGASGATKGLKRELDALKDSKRDITDLANKEVKADDLVVKSTERVIKSIEKERDTRLQNANATDKEISSLEKQIKQKEDKANIEITKATLDFNKANKGKSLELDKQENQLNQQLNVIKRQVNSFNDNKTANKDILADLTNQKEKIGEQIDVIKAQRDEIDLNKQSILTEIEIRQNATQQEIAVQKLLVVEKKAQNDQIKSDLEQSIMDQKLIIDELKIKIEDRKIKLDADISPIEEKLKQVQDKVDQISLSSGGGGGSAKASPGLSKQAIDEINSRNKNTRTDPKFVNKTEEEIDAILEIEATKKSTDLKAAIKNFAVQSPFTRLSASNLASSLVSFGIDPLAGVKDPNDKNGILNAGKDNILNSASDLIAFNVTRNPGKTSDQATDDFTRSLSELQGGQTESLKARFNISTAQLGNAAIKAGVSGSLEKDNKGVFTQQSFSNLQGEQVTKLINALVDVKQAKGLAKDLTNTFEGKQSNLQDQAGNLAEALFGDPKNAKSLISQIEKAVTNLTEQLGDPKVQEALSKFGERVGDLLDNAITPENISKLATAIEGFFNFVSQSLTPENTLKLGQAIGDIIDFAADPLADRSGKKADRKQAEFLSNKEKIDKIDLSKLTKAERDLIEITKAAGEAGNVGLAQKFVDGKNDTGDNINVIGKKPGTLAGGGKGTKVAALELGIEAQQGLLEVFEKQVEASIKLEEQFKQTANTYKTSFADSSVEVQTKITTAFAESTISAGNFTKTSDEKLTLFKVNLKTQFGTIPADIAKILDDTNLTTTQKLGIFSGEFSKSFSTINAAGVTSFADLTAKSLPELEAIRAKIMGTGEGEGKEKELGLIDSVIKMAVEVDKSKQSFTGLGIEGTKAFFDITKGIEGFLQKVGGDNLVNGLKDAKKAFSGLVTGNKDDILSGIGGIQKIITGKPEARAVGGPVNAGQMYQINEKGQEMFMPKGDYFVPPVDGEIITASDTASYLSAIKNYSNTMYSETAQRMASNTTNNNQSSVNAPVTQNFYINSSGSGTADSVYLQNMAGSSKAKALMYPQR